MLRILQIYDNTAINAGINIEIMNWYRNIDRSKCQFDFLSNWKEEPDFDNEINGLGGHSFHINEGVGIGNPLLFVSKVKTFMKRNVNKYDVVHLHTGPLCFPYLYYAKKYGSRIRIVHAHSQSTGNNPFSSFRNNLLLFPMKYIANTFIACSKEAAVEWFERRGISNFIVLNNGISREKFKKSDVDRKKIREELNIPDEEKVILHVSNMTSLKNIPFLIAVFERICRRRDDCVLLLVGKEALPDEVNQLINKYGLSNRIIVYGITEDVAKLINCSDICLMPSKKEGFGLVPIECQCCDKTVLISDGFPKVINASRFVIQLPLIVDEWVDNTCDILDGRKPSIIDNREDSLHEFEIKTVTSHLYNQYISYIDDLVSI